MSNDRNLRTVHLIDLTANAVRSIDEMCDCFEHRLYTRARLHIEDLLSGFQEPDRSILLQELLLLEVEHRIDEDETPTRESYFNRFPDHALIVQNVLKQLVPEPVLSQHSDNKDVLPVIPNYHVLRKLSQGGMGAVYEAMHTKLGKLVAIKVLRPNLSRDLEAEVRFEREMKIIGTLDHPNIVQARDAGKASGTHYLVMEYLVGCDLAGLVGKHGPLRIADACEIARQASLALTYAQKYSLVHRDIKPQNILIGRSSGADGAVQVKVADFGLTLLRGYPQDRDAKSTGEIVGTFAFMAPEQFWQQRSDIRSDIYSLGCTLYYLLLSRPPFAHSLYPEPRQLMEAHRKAEVPSLQETRSDVGDALQKVVERMLAKNPADRQRSPAVVSEQLAEFTAGYDLNLLIDDGEVDSVEISSDSLDLPETISRPINADFLADSDSLVSGLYAPSSARVPKANPLQSDAVATPATQRWSRTWFASAVGVALLLISYPMFSWYFASGSLDLLANINLPRDAISGDWKREHRILISPDSAEAQIALRHVTPASYRLEIDARRKTGGRLVIGLVHEGHQYPIILDSTTVFSNPVADEVSETVARQRAQDLGFTQGSLNTYTCIVRSKGVLVAFENQIQFVVERSELPSVADAQWQTNGYAGLFVGTHNSIYEFRSIVLTAVQD